MPPISAKVLSTRLSELEARGVLTRHVRRTSPPSTEYALTPLGSELLPALDAIVQVGHRLKEARAKPRDAARKTPPRAAGFSCVSV